jgi:hypothetical protein
MEDRTCAAWEGEPRRAQRGEAAIRSFSAPSVPLREMLRAWRSGPGTPHPDRLKAEI